MNSIDTYNGSGMKWLNSVDTPMNTPMNTPIQQSLDICNPRQGFYKTLREYKAQPLHDRLDVTFQVIGMLHGYTVLVLIPLIIGAIFFKQVIEWLKTNSIVQLITRRK